MPSKRELSPEQVQEIRSLRGQLPAAEAKKRFGIGTTRLYKIWRDGASPPAGTPAGALDPPLAGSLAGSLAGTPARALAGAPAGPLAGSLVKASPLARVFAGPPAGPLAKSLAKLPDAGGSCVESQNYNRMRPTAADFLGRLDRLEARVEEASRLLVQALAQLPKDDDSDVLEQLLVDEQQEIAEQLRETRHEQAETRMDLQKVGQVVKTAQNWAYISIAAVIVLKIVTATWNRGTPRQKPQPQKPQPQEVESAKPGGPFYMA